MARQCSGPEWRDGTFPGSKGSRVKRLLDMIPAASWTVVMGSGIVSIDLYSDQPVLSAIMLWFAAGAWLLLAVVLGARLADQRDRFALEVSSPASLTGVAGTAVLGTRLTMQDYHVAAVALLAVSGLGWVLLLMPVLQHWKTPTAGISFVLCVATEGLAVLGATLAITYRAGWLVSAAVPALVLGLAFYVLTAARFDLRELLTGQGDQWVAGGAPAISALAAGKCTEAAGALGQFSEQHQVLTASTLVLWCLAMVWLFPLVTGEVLKPRLSYDVRRWATVFPLGMYAACSFATGQVTGITGIGEFGHVWTWVAFTVSLLVLAGLFRHSWPVLRGRHRPTTEDGRRSRLLGPMAGLGRGGAAARGERNFGVGATIRRPALRDVLMRLLVSTRATGALNRTGSVRPSWGGPLRGPIGLG
jgi:tellurite resistance protein TehA-like permease